MNCELKEYFSKKNENSYIYLLHEYGKFDIDKFNEYLDEYSILVEKHKESPDKEQYKKILEAATDILIYTIAELSFHFDSNDCFEIINYNDLNVDGLYDDYWGYDNISNYIISKIRENIAKNFL